MTIQEIQALEEQKKGIMEQIVAIDSGQGEPSEKASLVDQLNAISNAIEEKKYELQLQKEKEENEAHFQSRVEENVENIAYFLDTLVTPGLEGETYTMRDLTDGEPAYQILRSVIQAAMMEREEKLLNELNREKQDALEQIAQLRIEKEKLQSQYDTLYEEANAVRNELNTAIQEKNDAERKRDAAAIELDSANKEIERLNSQVDDLRTEIAIGAKNAIKVYDVKSNMTHALEEFKAQRQKEEQEKTAIYDIQPLDNKRSRYSAKLAETDEVIEFGYLEKGRYREVTPEVASTFRAAYEEKRSNEDHAQPGEIVEENGVAPQPNEEAVSIVVGMDEGNTDGEVAAETDKTVEERLAELEERVNNLEQQRLGEAA